MNYEQKIIKFINRSKMVQNRFTKHFCCVILILVERQIKKFSFDL